MSERRRRSLCSWRTTSVVLILVCCFREYQRLFLSQNLLNWTTGYDQLPHNQTRVETSIRVTKNATIPEALQPVKFYRCCDNFRITDKEAFFRPCLTEKACNNSTYPFSSQQEADSFARWDPTIEEKHTIQGECRVASEQPRPPMSWCQDDLDQVSLIFPRGCSKYSMGGGSGPYDRLFVFPQGKLAFCGIPKAGITKWLQFLRFTNGAKDYQSYPHSKSDTEAKRLEMMRPEILEQILQDPTWTRAVFIRNPAERLLSAYLDKVAGRTDHVARNNTTFEEFVDLLAMTNITNMGGALNTRSGLSWYSDPHWRPQAWSCGLSENMPSFQYVATLDRVDVHAKALLQKVDMWESFGKHYRVSRQGETRGKQQGVWPPEPLKPRDEPPLGFQQHNATDRHSTGASRKFDEYYTPQIMEKVKKLYWMDFALWDALLQADKEGKVHGKDIAQRLNPKCKRKSRKRLFW